MPDDGSDGKRDGMRRAKIHADPYWWQCMLESCKEVALRKPYFYTDDVVRWCREHHPNATTHEHRAIGPLMTAACKLEYCIKTQDWVESMQKQCHKRPMRVWFSLIYQGRPYPRPRRRKPNDPNQFTMDLEE